mgnify:CR=1 FL=1
MSYDNTFVGSGNLARDIEGKVSANGNTFGVGAIALSEGKDKPATFLDFIIFGDLAENAAESFSKGDRVVVRGSLTQDRWEDNEGNKRSRIKLIVDDIGGSARWGTLTVHKTERWTGPDDDNLI